MKNLTEIFKKVIESNVNWQFSLFYYVLDILKNNKIEVSFWEGEENWASILMDKKVVGYIWKIYPLIILEHEISFQVKYILQNINWVNYISVNSLSKDLFKIENKEIEKYFENFNNFKSFTIEDLWFQTNSK